MDTESDVIADYLDLAGIVVEAVTAPDVGAMWDAPSVLEEQTVGGLAGHLARGGVWLVGEYLDLGVPTGPVDFGSAGEYFAAFSMSATAESERAIRDRGAAVAAQGHAGVAEEARDRLAVLAPRLRTSPPERHLAVVGGRVMRLDDYLVTRIVEQVVHLDDLARSLGRDPYPVPEDAAALVLAVGLDVARRRSGDVAVLRAVYRGGFAGGTFPVF